MTHWSNRLGASVPGIDPSQQARLALDQVVMAPLVHLGVLEVAGADAVRFLQGQTSAQVDSTNQAFAPLTAFCSAKGRMLANAQLLRIDDQRLWLILPQECIASLKAHLGKFTVFYKVEMRERDDMALLGVIGKHAPALVEATCDIVPPKTWHRARNGDMHLLRHPGPQPRLLLCVPTTEVDALWERLESRATLVDAAVWRLYDIQAGLAWITDTHRDAYLPQMFNWEALGGISFKKGCYTGQEVVARAHFRGQVKKRLARIQLEGAELPPPATPVEDATGKRHGDVIAAELDAYGQVELLAVLGIKETDEPLNVGGQRCKRLHLPYPLERVDPEALASA